MPEDSRISEFLAKAISAGIPHQSLVGLLTARGWRDKEIYNALAEHYRIQTGIEVPRRASTGASAKDAFFYLLIFSTLATWTCSLGSLAFTLIDRWLSDPLFSGYAYQYSNYEVTWSLAAILVSFPLFLLISRAVIREAALDPDKFDSGIRKWLTYMALVIAAGVFMGDLIAALSYLLRGELTSRFLSKSFVVLALSGGVFYYYFGGLRKTEVALVKAGRDKFMAGLSSAIVVLMVIFGFLQLGPPSNQREIRADAQRVTQLYRLSTDVEAAWKSHPAQTPQTLPPTLNALHGNLTDPITHAPYEYRPGQGSKYELCAVFTQPSPTEPVNFPPNPWSHTAGHYCFQLDATLTTQFPAQPVQ